jgi:hypothetical protein
MEDNEYEKLRKQFESTIRYFDRQGNPIEILDWARKCQDYDYKLVKQEEVGKYFVSTIWVGLNMSMWRNNPIQIFETMIFLNEGSDEERRNDPICDLIHRYSTEEQALAGHERAVGVASGSILLDQDE